MIELYVLLVFMIIGAIIAIEMKDLLSAVIAVGAVGLGLSLVFLVLKAPDVAITQIVVEMLCLIIL
jgi:multicomponent Na+:H+ antiporter subunit B